MTATWCEWCDQALDDAARCPDCGGEVVET